MAHPDLRFAHCGQGRSHPVTELAVRDETFDDVILLTGPMNLGGIETLILRLSRAMVEQGKSVHLLCSGGELTKNLAPAVKLVEYDGWHDALRRFRALRDQLGRSASILVISFDPVSAAIASWLIGQSTMASGDRHISGVFHPKAYFLDGEDKLRFTINRMTLANFRDDQLFFMNQECRDSHARWARRTFLNSAIIPLAIDTVDALYSGRDGNPFKVVTVGRLVAFKDYNLEIPRIVDQLRTQGIKVEWQIFGAGELKAEIQRRIDQHDVGEFVSLRGELPYSRFAAEVAGHDAFVGMGTAVLEAAMLGAPAIVAVINHGDRTYGFLQALPFGNVGEIMGEEPTETIGALLADLFAMTPAARVALGQQSRKSALAYSEEDYAAGLLRIGADSSPINSFRSWFVGKVYHEATDGVSRKFADRTVHSCRRLARAIARVGRP